MSTLAHFEEEDGFFHEDFVQFQSRNEERRSRDDSALQQTKQDTIITAVGRQTDSETNQAAVFPDK